MKTTKYNELTLTIMLETKEEQTNWFTFLDHPLIQELMDQSTNYDLQIPVSLGYDLRKSKEFNEYVNKVIKAYSNTLKDL